MVSWPVAPLIHPLIKHRSQESITDIHEIPEGGVQLIQPQTAERPFPDTMTLVCYYFIYLLHPKC